MEKGKENNEDPQKSIFIWNSEKKRPGVYIFILLIMITIAILTVGIIDLINMTHEIKVVVEFDGKYQGEIRYDTEFESINGGTGYREFSFKVQEGKSLEVYIYRPSSNRDLLKVSIYNNGDLVMQETSTQPWSTINLEYTVGE